MPKSCSAFNCTNRYNNKNPDITFHRFPFSKPSILKQWLDNIGRGDFQPSKHMVLCSLHFTPDCFSGLGNRKNLLWNAVPTLFPIPDQDPKQKNSRKKPKKDLKSVTDDKWDNNELIEDIRNEHAQLLSLNNEEEYHQTTKDAAAADHTYALSDPCATKARLFDVLDVNRWLQRRLQTKCRVIKRMRLKLQAAKRELLTLRCQHRYSSTHHQRRSQIPIQRDTVEQ